MKKLIFAGIILVGAIAQAALPSRQEIAQAELTYVKTHAGVKARVAYLGGTNFQASETKNNTYTVVTDNGCAFNARIAYGEFGYTPNHPNKGIQALYLSKSVCK